jgi:alpha-galactosidase
MRNENRPSAGPRQCSRRSRPTRFAIFLCSAGLFLFHVAGCKKNSTVSSSQNAPTAKSVVGVQISSGAIAIHTPEADFQLLPNGALTASLKKGASKVTLDAESLDSAQSISLSGREHPGVILDLANAEVRDAAGKLGQLGKQINITGNIPGTDVEETATLEVYDAFPNLALLSIGLRNAGNSDIRIDSLVFQRHTFAGSANSSSSAAPTPLWTFQGSSLKWGKDEIFLMPRRFSQENPFGTPVETNNDLGRVGGGVPVVAFWSRNVAEAIGHIETLPLTLSLPVQTTPDARVDASVRIPADTRLKPGEIYSTPRTFLAIFSGDYYEPLSLWSAVIDKEGLPKPINNEENYAVSWCGWGYEFGVTPKQMLDTIPKLQELGIHWATLDDGWFNDYGDWRPREPVFAGDAIPDMVRKFHEQGIKVQLWWLPLAVEDGHFAYGGRTYVVSDVVKQHPDWLILDQHGKPARMARNLATLCPAVLEVQAYYKQLTERFIRGWGFDGHKLDNIYATPLCYNPKHHHKSPTDSVYAMGNVYRTIFETTRALKPDSVTQSCPCGTPPSVAWLRFLDQAVTADPIGSIQVRRRVKMYKALLGPHAAVYGDHVELTLVTNIFADNEQDVGEDFASTLGTGGVLGTKFTWPDYGPKFKTVYLNPTKEAHWKKWISLYKEKMLSKGDFRNLYIYGFDSPEAYAIEKDGSLYYAFYAPAGPVVASNVPGVRQSWVGEIELRGLDSKPYHVMDYVNHQDLGTVVGPVARLKVEFIDHLLLEAMPVPEKQ